MQSDDLFWETYKRFGISRVNSRGISNMMIVMTPEWAQCNSVAQLEARCGDSATLRLTPHSIRNDPSVPPFSVRVAGEEDARCPLLGDD